VQEELEWEAQVEKEVLEDIEAQHAVPAAIEPVAAD